VGETREADDGGGVNSFVEGNSGIAPDKPIWARYGSPRPNAGLVTGVPSARGPAFRRVRARLRQATVADSVDVIGEQEGEARLVLRHRQLGVGRPRFAGAVCKPVGGVAHDPRAFPVCIGVTAVIEAEPRSVAAIESGGEPTVGPVGLGPIGAPSARAGVGRAARQVRGGVDLVHDAPAGGGLIGIQGIEPPRLVRIRRAAVARGEDEHVVVVAADGHVGGAGPVGLAGLGGRRAVERSVPDLGRVGIRDLVRFRHAGTGYFAVRAGGPDGALARVAAPVRGAGPAILAGVRCAWVDGIAERPSDGQDRLGTRGSLGIGDDQLLRGIAGRSGETSGRERLFARETPTELSRDASGTIEQVGGALIMGAFRKLVGSNEFLPGSEPRARAGRHLHLIAVRPGIARIAGAYVAIDSVEACAIHTRARRAFIDFSLAVRPGITCRASTRVSVCLIHTRAAILARARIAMIRNVGRTRAIGTRKSITTRNRGITRRVLRQTPHSLALGIVDRHVIARVQRMRIDTSRFAHLEDGVGLGLRCCPVANLNLTIDRKIIALRRRQLLIRNPNMFVALRLLRRPTSRAQRTHQPQHRNHCTQKLLQVQHVRLFTFCFGKSSSPNRPNRSCAKVCSARQNHAIVGFHVLTGRRSRAVMVVFTALSKIQPLGRILSNLLHYVVTRMTTTCLFGVPLPELGQFRRRFDAELFQGMSAMVLHGAFSNPQFIGDLFVEASLDDQSADLPFPLGQEGQTQFGWRQGGNGGRTEGRGWSEQTEASSFRGAFMESFEVGGQEWVESQKAGHLGNSRNGDRRIFEQYLPSAL